MAIYTLLMTTVMIMMFDVITNCSERSLAQALRCAFTVLNGDVTMTSYTVSRVAVTRLCKVTINVKYNYGRVNYQVFA